jgi:hypothetical protein
MSEYIVAYEVTSEQMPYIFFVASFIVLAIAFIIPANTKTIGFIKNRKLTIAFMVFLSVAFLFLGISETKSYMKMLEEYRNNKFKVIEGDVAQFDPMPYGGKKNESFVIGKNKFSYSDYIVIYGFHNTSSHGGPINHNGINVRISYVTDENNENIILKLEINRRNQDK